MVKTKQSVASTLVQDKVHFISFQSSEVKLVCTLTVSIHVVSSKLGKKPSKQKCEARNELKTMWEGNR
jgi:hypothetical protein